MSQPCVSGKNKKQNGIISRIISDGLLPVIKPVINGTHKQADNIIHAIFCSEDVSIRAENNNPSVVMISAHPSVSGVGELNNA